MTSNVNMDVTGRVGTDTNKYVIHHVDDNFILPKCIGVVDVFPNGDPTFPVYVDPNDKRLIGKIKNRQNDNGSIVEISRISRVLTETAGTVISIPLTYDTHKRFEHRLMSGTFVAINFAWMVQQFMDVCGVRYDGSYNTAMIRDGKFKWRRVMVVYRVIGDGFSSVEFGHPFENNDCPGMSLYCSFLKPNSKTFIRLYLYDMSSLAIDNFAVSAVVGSTYKYGLRVLKYDVPEKVRGMYDTVYDEDIPKRNLEAFHSSSYYLRILGSMDAKTGRSEVIYDEFGKPDLAGRYFGLMTGEVVEVDGIGSMKYSGLHFDTTKAGLFAHSFVNEFSEPVYLNSHGYEYEASFYTRMPKNEKNTIYLTSRTAHLENGGLIIQQMPGHLYFADVFQIDDMLNRVGYDPYNQNRPI